MVELKVEKCVACRRDSAPVTQEELENLHPLVSDWSLISEDGIKKLNREFGFPNFQQALDFTAEVGALAENEGHHPRLVTEWGRVKITWWTHKIRNLHRNDFVMAAKSDALYAQSSAEAPR
ncbi:MAG: 4a-hydroxytetrahydrobiopterin dehydratase [SAR202 cluster bacterium Io17-Chloro-G9]|nr:MAG: 4a-hydroxytetrahydrobiopterin dehydratase [SAR202 cluster bacterium Io17-Chloro-G9]